jgi:hypothetical protein
VLGEKLANEECSVTGCIDMENPILHVSQIQSLLPNVLPQMLQNFAVKLCVDSLALGDKFAMNNAMMSKNTMRVVFVELWLILAFSHGDGLFHCDDCHFVSGLYPWLVSPFCP